MLAEAFEAGKAESEAERKRQAKADEQLHLRRVRELERLGGDILKVVNAAVDVSLRRNNDVGLQNDTVERRLRSIEECLKKDPVMHGPPQAQFALAQPAAE
jgi:hypothetical protein